MTAPEALRALAIDVRRLVPDRRDPEAFHMSKSEIENRLRRLARDLERQRAG